MKAIAALGLFVLTALFLTYHKNRFYACKKLNLSSKHPVKQHCVIQYELVLGLKFKYEPVSNAFSTGFDMAGIVKFCFILAVPLLPAPYAM